MEVNIVNPPSMVLSAKQIALGAVVTVLLKALPMKPATMGR